MSDRIRAEAIRAKRGDRDVLHDVSLAVRAGDAVALIGPNAAGKSTLLRTVAGLLRPMGGRVLVEGRPLASWRTEALARVLAFVAPEQEGLAALTVRDRVALGRFPHRGPFRALTREDHRAVDRALEKTGIASLAHRRLSTLSAGERQLSALARALAQEPGILLLDEPAAHLDIGHALQLFRVLDEIRACGVAVLAVIHDLSQAAAWCERMILLAGGRIAAEGPPRDVLTGAPCAEAFGVSVIVHETGARPAYRFEQPAVAASDGRSAARSGSNTG
jgi:iron complex transport system ATP-binding protein